MSVNCGDEKGIALEQEDQEAQKDTIFTLPEVGDTIKGVVTWVVGMRDLKKRSVRGSRGVRQLRMSRPKGKYRMIR